MSVRHNLVFQLPVSMITAWPWVIALDQWDHGDPAPVADLVRTIPIPDELRPVLADIVAGIRKPNLRARARLKVPAGERLDMAQAILRALGCLNDCQKKGATPSLEETADRHGLEPIEMMREFERRGAQVIADFAIYSGVSEQIIKKTIQELRNKIKDYPNI